MHNKTKQLSFLIIDIFCFYLALFVSLLIRLRQNFTFYKYLQHVVPFSFLFILWFLVFYVTGLYDLKNFSKRFLLFKLFISAVLISFILSIIFFYFAKIPEITPKTILILFSGFFFIINFLLRQSLFKGFVKSEPLLNILILGEGDDVKEFVKFVGEHPQLGYSVKITTNELKNGEINKLVSENSINTILATSKFRKDKHLSSKIYQQMLNGVDVFGFAEFYENVFGKISLDELEESWFLEKIMPKNGFYTFLKRTFDIIFALIIFIVALPFLPLIALLIKISSYGSVFFKQERVGLREKSIIIYKLRTMRNLNQGEVKDILFHEGDLNLETEQNLSRVFLFGKFLRRTRLDEIPQVMNILKGELSFIGPRVEFVALHNHLKEKIPYYQIGTIITPGLTGWAQIYGKNSNTEEDAKERLAFDIYYIKNRSLALDLIIALKTLKTIFTFSGV